MMGRNKSENPLSKVLLVRVTPAEAVEIAKAAEAAGFASGRGPGVSGFLRGLGLNYARTWVDPKGGK